MTDVFVSQIIEDFTLDNAKYEDEIWTSATARCIEALIEEAKTKDLRAYDFVEVSRRRLKEYGVEREGITYRGFTYCPHGDPEATGWELRMKASTRPLDTVASSD